MGQIFFAVSDREWVLDGANVHVSMVGFDKGEETETVLDGRVVADINSNLTSSADITQARRLQENYEVSYYADVKSGKFDLPFAAAAPLLTLPNPNGRPNSDVLRPWANGRDIVQRSRQAWIIDFASSMSIRDASLYEEPFRIVEALVKPERDKVNRKRYREYWWLHAEPCAEMRRRVEALDRFLVTTMVSKHRVFAWMHSPTLPDHQLIAFARSDDYFFGVLQSRVHEVWGLKLGTRLETRPRYTPTTCFETFPFPEATESQRTAIAAAAAELDRLRSNWLNPPEWVREDVLEFAGSVGGPWARYVHDANDRGVGVVRFPRLVPRDEDCAHKLAERTLTKLYNLSPPWLQLAHRALDEAVFAAYGLAPAASDETILAALLEMNQRRAGR
jgi:type II restriction/modification system DNA methylase subunit YeeA